jgi:hypothetical protein
MASMDSYFVVRTMQALEVTTLQPCTAPQVAELLRVDARTARRLLNRLADERWLLRSEGPVRTYTMTAPPFSPARRRSRRFESRRVHFLG